MKTMSEQRKDTIAHFHSSSFTLALLQADHARGRKGFLPTFLILFLTVTIWKKKKKSLIPALQSNSSMYIPSPCSRSLRLCPC